MPISLTQKNLFFRIQIWVEMVLCHWSREADCCHNHKPHCGTSSSFLWFSSRAPSNHPYAWEKSSASKYIKQKVVQWCHVLEGWKAGFWLAEALWKGTSFRWESHWSMREDQYGSEIPPTKPWTLSLPTPVAWTMTQTTFLMNLARIFHYHESPRGVYRQNVNIIKFL